MGPATAVEAATDIVIKVYGVVETAKPAAAHSIYFILYKADGTVVNGGSVSDSL